MDAVRPSFILEEPPEGSIKPLPYRLKKPKEKVERVRLPNSYPKYEVEFYDVIRTCAEYIDKIHDIDKRIKYNKDLNRIFIIRHRGAAMRLFKELFNVTIGQGEKNVSV